MGQGAAYAFGPTCCHFNIVIEQCKKYCLMINRLHDSHIFVDNGYVFGINSMLMGWLSGIYVKHNQKLTNDHACK